MKFSKLEREFEETIFNGKFEIVLLVVKKYLNAILIRLKFYQIKAAIAKVLRLLANRFAPAIKLGERVLSKLRRMLSLPQKNSSTGSSGPLIDQPLKEAFIYLGETYHDVEQCIRAVRKIHCEVVVCCAFNGRHKVLEGVLSDILQDESIGICLAGSSWSDLELLKRLSQKNERVFGIIADNFPLGAKWQKVIDVALGFFETDLFAITGSDDVLPTSTIKAVHKHYTNSGLKPALYGCRSWYIYYWLKEGFQRGCLKCEYSGEFAKKTLGAGRVYTRDFFNAESSNIFDVRRSRRLDERGHNMAIASGKNVIYYDELFDLPISIKGEWDQLNDIAEIVGAKTLKSSYVGKELFDELYHKHLALRQFSRENIHTSNDVSSTSFAANDLVVVIPHVGDAMPSNRFVSLFAARGTYMYKMFEKDGLSKFESEALGVTAALIDYYEVSEFADVGANIGAFSWCMKAIFGDELDVYAYEPLPMLANVLENLCQDNGLNISINTEAMSDNNGEATFYVSASTDSSNSLNKDFREAKDEINVETIKMTTAFGDRRKPRVIKIDTETTEPAVLAGGAEYIDKERPFLIIEVLANRTEDPLTKFCQKHNYSAYRLDGSPLEPAKDIVGDKTYKFRDWLFVPSEVELSHEFYLRYLEWVNAFSGELEKEK